MRPKPRSGALVFGLCGLLVTNVVAAGDPLPSWDWRQQVHSPKGQLPPVNGFWSLTLYNKEHLFEQNALNRYSLGTKSKSLKYGSDGSLTLYFQNKSPGADKESNWVPAPADEFSLYIRAYWPKAEILEAKWMPPKVEKVK